HEDRTLYFDFLQLELGKISGLTPKIHLYTVPGQPYYEASRRLVLRGVDGIVFVADSAAPRTTDNLESWKNMHAHLASLGIDAGSLPIVMQYNKRDLPDAIPVSVLHTLLQGNGRPAFEAVALRGEGVFDTLKTVINHVVRAVQQQTA
ncbi:MAG: gliding-motility protein MglA, partial [Caldilineae bacterium]